MSALWRVLSVRAWLWVAAGAAALLVSVSGYSFWKGYDWRDTIAEAEQKAVLEAQAKRLEADYQRKLAAQAALNRGKDEARRIREAPRPDVALCDAGDDWLHHIQDSVRRANAVSGAQ